jgi:hypothetical protein
VAPAVLPAEARLADETAGSETLIEGVVTVQDSAETVALLAVTVSVDNPRFSTPQPRPAGGGAVSLVRTRLR